MPYIGASAGMVLVMLVWACGSLGRCPPPTEADSQPSGPTPTAPPPSSEKTAEDRETVAVEDPPSVTAKPECVNTEPTPFRSILSADILAFANAVSSALNDREASPEPNNTYSHETAYGAEQLARPRIYLSPARTYSALASTDCSGWVDFVVNTVSPLHHAVLQSQKRRPEYNRSYEDGFTLRESERAWARAFVLTNFFRSDFASSTGFERLLNHESVRNGDLVAYSLGRYIDPADTRLTKPRNTGHVFIIAGAPTIVSSDAADYDGQGTLSEQAVEVLAMSIIDSSSVPHFDPDSRKNNDGKYTLPYRVPYRNSKSGGIGIGTAWFALDANRRIIQRRLGPDDRYNDVIISAVRPRHVISLIPEIVDDEGYLVVDVFDNTPTDYNGMILGHLPVTLTGQGGIRLVRGELVLGGESNFTGGVVIDAGALVVEAETALGSGDVEIKNGTLQMNYAAIADHANLRLAKRLQDGAVHLGFEGRDVIHSLQIGDTVHRCGTWGSFESDADFTDPRFSGRGVLLLNADTDPDCTEAEQAR